MGASSAYVKPTSVDPGRVLPLHVEGRDFVASDGSQFIWRGMTAFRLLHMIANNEDIEPYLGWCATHGVTIVRTLAMAKHLFDLAPERGLRALPQLLGRAGAHGLRVEVVALADTKSYEFDIERHVQEIGDVCGAHPACVIELGNELEPLHPTQDDRLADARYVGGLRGLVPSSVLVALGSAHGGTMSEKFGSGDFVTIHEDRSDADEGWRWASVRDETRQLSERLRKPVVGDEPRRDDTRLDRQFAAGALARMFGVGDTFHYQGGLTARIPLGKDLAAFEARRRGWESIPEGFRGSYRPTGAPDSAVVESNRSKWPRVFAVADNRTGYAIILGPVQSALKWSDQWPTRPLVAEVGQAALWRVSR
jgi:hypothetical protein